MNIIFESNLMQYLLPIYLANVQNCLCWTAGQYFKNLINFHTISN